MNSDWSVIWPGDGEDKTIALVKLFAMVTLSLKVTWYALRWLPSKVNPIVPFTTIPPTNRNTAQIFSSKTVFFLPPSLWQTPRAAKERRAGGVWGRGEVRWSHSWRKDGARAHRAGCSSNSMSSCLWQPSQINQDFHNAWNFKVSYVHQFIQMKWLSTADNKWCSVKRNFCRNTWPAGQILM